MDVKTTLWDALVIGAGPAGTLAAHGLARRGMKTLLVEGKAFPRDKVCGGYVNGRALAVLQSAGLGTLCHDLGGKSLSRVEIRSSHQKLSLPLPTGIALSRYTLDTALVEEAQREGAAFLSETKATVTPDTDSDSRYVRLQSQGEDPVIVRSKIVLACDGLNHSSLRELDQFQSRVSPRSHIGVGGVVEDSSACYPDGQVFMSIGPQGYVGVTRVEEGRICLAAALNVDYVREKGMEKAVLAILQEAGTPVAESLHRMDFSGTPPLTRHTPVLADERLFLLGDAAGYVEPFTGEGMAIACVGAERLVPLAERAARQWKPQHIREWNRIHRSAIGSRLVLCRTLASLVRHPWAVRTTLGFLGFFPKLGTLVVNRINSIDPPASPQPFDASTTVPSDLKACNL